MYCAARGPAPQASQFFDEIGAGRLLGPRGPGQVDRVIDHVLTGRHLADELLNPKDVLPAGAPAGPPDAPVCVVAITISRSSLRVG